MNATAICLANEGVSGRWKVFATWFTMVLDRVDERLWVLDANAERERLCLDGPSLLGKEPENVAGAVASRQDARLGSVN